MPPSGAAFPVLAVAPEPIPRVNPDPGGVEQQVRAGGVAVAAAGDTDHAPILQGQHPSELHGPRPAWAYNRANASFCTATGAFCGLPL